MGLFASGLILAGELGWCCMATPLELYLNRVRGQVDRDWQNAPLRQRLAEMYAACGDFDVARRLHGEATRLDPTLARCLTTPRFTQSQTPAVLCAISNICNINCRICETQDATVPKGNMDFDLICTIVDQCKAHNIHHMLLHHVNEPLLHPAIFDVLLYLEAKDMGAWISTNANEMRSVLTRARRQVRLPTKLSLRYSIDAGRRETYNEIRRGGDFDKVVEGAIAVRDFCAERGIALTTSSNYVMTAKSIHELADFADTFGGLIPFDQMYFSFVGGNTPTGLNQYIIDNRVTDFIRRTPCDVPFVQMNILKDGRVSLCCIDFNEEAIVGDLRTYGMALSLLSIARP
jgi:sulfatase maturation enzyme AslB (radical SAM superfamily)